MTDYVKSVVLEDIIESQIMADILEERKIPNYIRSFQDDAYGNLFQTSKGWGRIYAPKEYKEEIQAIINELRKGV